MNSTIIYIFAIIGLVFVIGAIVIYVLYLIDVMKQTNLSKKNRYHGALVNILNLADNAEECKNYARKALNGEK